MTGRSDRRSSPATSAALAAKIALATSAALAATVLLVLAAAPATGQEADATADRAAEVASLVDLAVTEYRDAVADGEVVNEMEYDEAGAFTREAAAIFAEISAASPTPEDEAIASGLDSLRAVGPIQTFREVAGEVSSSLTESRGAISVPEPTRRPDAARGAVLYRTACAACHGATGEGDGWAADGMEPPPADLTSTLRWQEATPARDFQVVTYGVPATAMPASADWLTPETAWDLVAFVRALPFGAAEVAEGKSLALGGGGQPNPLAGRLRTWSAPSEVARVTDAELARRVQARWAEAAASSRTGDAGASAADTADPASARDSLAEERARAVVAYLRTLMGTSVEGVPEADRAASVAAALERADSLAVAASELARDGRTDDARSTALRSYMAFEGVEPELRSRSPGLVREAEVAFATLRGSIGQGGAEAALGSLRDLLERAEQEVAEPVTGWSLATQSFFIILREGFEAILILGAILAFLVKTNNEQRKRDVYLGTGAALVASVATAFVLQRVLAATPASRELLEGATMLLAVVVLFSVSYWLLSKLEHEKWEAYLRAKMKSALGAGSGLALAGVAFLAVYREGFETVIFYQALLGFTDGGTVAVAGGFVVGCVALAVIYVLFTRYGVKIPMRPFFAVTSGVLYYMAVVFAGSGIRELQEAGVVDTTMVGGVPTVELLGLYPTLETLAAQGFLLVLLGVALAITFGPSLAGRSRREEARAGSA